MNLFGKHKSTSDEVIIRSIRIGGIAENDALKVLYKQNVRPITSFIMKNSGHEEDAREILQQSIIVLYEKIKTGAFESKAKLSTYLFSVAKNKWYSQLKRKEKPTEDVSYSSTGADVYVMHVTEEHTARNKAEWISGLMNQLKSDCKDILIYSVYQKYSMTEIADMMDFKNEQIARNKKSKCLGYFKKLILNQADAKQILAS